MGATDKQQGIDGIMRAPGAAAAASRIDPDPLVRAERVE